MGALYIVPSYQIYPDPVCMECGQTDAAAVEEVDTGARDFELWSYCKRCDVETFHEAIATEIRVADRYAEPARAGLLGRIQALRDSLRCCACKARLYGG